MRCVTYSYYNAALADGAEYVITQRGMFSIMCGAGGVSCKIGISGDGTNWNTTLAGPAYPVCYAGETNRLKVKNSAGSAQVLHVSGWYLT